MKFDLKSAQVPREFQLVAVTKDEINRILQHIDQRFNKLEQKIDNLMQRNVNA